MTVTTVTAQEGRVSAAQSRPFDTFPAREVNLGSFIVMRALPIREKREGATCRNENVSVILGELDNTSVWVLDAAS